MLANILWQPRISVEQPSAEVATRLYCGVRTCSTLAARSFSDVCIKIADAIRLGLFDYFPEFGLVGRAVYVSHLSHLSSHAGRLLPLGEHPSDRVGAASR